MSWTELDPGQGNPDALLVLATDLQAEADDAASAARTLRSIQGNADDGVWRGSAADAFRDRIDKVPGHLDKLNASYLDAAAGLRAYAASVRQIADEARRQQQNLDQSQADLATAQSAQASWTAPPHPLIGLPDTGAINPHDDQVAAARATATRAQAGLADLAGQRQSADTRLVSALKHAHSEGMKNKHWWQKALDVASAALAKITIVLLVVALVAIVVLAIVQPELIPGLLLAAGRVMTALSAAQLAVDGTRKASGENVGWGSLALDAMGLLPGAGKLGTLAESVPVLSRGVTALRDASETVRGFGAAGGAFLHSLSSDLKATRFVVRVADTGLGTFMASVERDGKSAGQMLTDAKGAAKTQMDEGSAAKPPKVHADKQGKHIRGHRGFTGRSELQADPDELAKKAGSGEQAGDKLRGESGFKERIDYGKEIGLFKDKDTGILMPTSVGMIHYASDGTIHIVPARPTP